MLKSIHNNGRHGGRPYVFTGISAMRMVFVGRGSVPAHSRQITAASVMFKIRVGLRASRTSIVSRRSCLITAFITQAGDRSFKIRKPKAEWELQWTIR
jgi:hypothetical protein